MMMARLQEACWGKMLPHSKHRVWYPGSGMMWSQVSRYRIGISPRLTLLSRSACLSTFAALEMTNDCDPIIQSKHDGHAARLLQQQQARAKMEDLKKRRHKKRRLGRLLLVCRIDLSSDA